MKQRVSLKLYSAILIKFQLTVFSSEEEEGQNRSHQSVFPHGPFCSKHRLQKDSTPGTHVSRLHGYRTHYRLKPNFSIYFNVYKLHTFHNQCSVMLSYSLFAISICKTQQSYFRKHNLKLSKHAAQVSDNLFLGQVSFVLWLTSVLRRTL